MTEEQAIETLKNYPCVCKYGTSPIKCTDTECDFGKAIRTLIERPKGKWEFVQYDANPNIGNWHCSNCNGISDSRFNFCPNCGAEMRGEENA